MCVYLNTRVCFIFICIYTCVCVHIYSFMHLCIHIHTHILYTHIRAYVHLSVNVWAVGLKQELAKAVSTERLDMGGCQKHGPLFGSLVYYCMAPNIPEAPM